LGNMIFGLEVMFIGFAGVFIALTILYILLVLLDKFFAKKNGKANAQKPTAAATDLKLSLSSPVKKEPDDEDQGELMAVISAAISAYLQKPQASLAIRSINPVTVKETNSWKSYGRTRQMDLKSSFSAKRREKRK
jgi:sodium pump decarboxylase gamma subunit